MKSLTQYIHQINEKRHISSDVIAMADYIYDLLKQMVETPAENPKYKTQAYELYKDSGIDEYDIEISFNDIPGFTGNHKLLSGQWIHDWEYDNADFVVQLTDMDAFGTMDTKEPILQISVNTLKSVRTFQRKESELRNTLMHELTHYVQYFAGMAGMTNGRLTKRYKSDYDPEFHNAVDEYIKSNKTVNNRYYRVSYIIYAFHKNERFARVAGFHGTVRTEFDLLLKEFKKLNKKEPTKEEFIEFVVNNHKYDANVIHLNIYDDFIESLKNDTYTNFKSCVDDTTTIFREDSMLYVFLNMCDHLTPKPTWLVPKKICIYSTRTEQDFEEARKVILDRFTKNYKQYKNNLADIVEDIWDEHMK